jgi:Metallo-peptidase family M12B Reprolysin-like
MAVSLRKLSSALGLPSQFSVCRDMFGFTGSRVPAPLSTTRPRPVLSLTRFAQLLRGEHFHVRLIVAGSDLLTTNDQDVIDYAVFRLRDIYSTAGIGVGLVTRDLRTAANSAGHATVSTVADITAAGADLTADGDFVPVVLPANMNVTTTNPDGTVTVTLGVSPVGGPCSPRTADGMRSAVVDINGEGTGRTLAHEVGHYLGADHPSAVDSNLMAQTGAVTNAGGDPFVTVTIIATDKTKMLDHCTIRPALAGI